MNMLRRVIICACQNLRVLSSHSAVNSIRLISLYKRTKSLPRSIFTSGSIFSAAILINNSDLTSDIEKVKKAENLYCENKFKEVYEYLLQFRDCENAEILWRLVRAARDRSNMDDLSKDEKKTMIFEAFEISKKALECGKDNFACHKWFGIMLSQTGDYLGTKKKIEDSLLMKKHFEKAVELNPTDATSHHLIGMWCFSFADLAWYERKIAAVVFGSPPESTYEEAYNHFKEAENLGPGTYSTNQYMLGLVLLKLGNKKDAKEWFEKLLEYNAVKTEDFENVKKAREYLKSL